LYFVLIGTSNFNGISICSRPEERLYVVHCDDAIGSVAIQGCMYEFTSRNTTLNGTLAANDSRKIGLYDFHDEGFITLTVIDLKDNIVVKSDLNSSSISVCVTSTKGKFAFFN